MTTHYSPVYSGSLTNHLPMLEWALKKLNVPKDIIETRYSDYVARTGIIDLDSAYEKLSDFEHYYLKRVDHYKEQLLQLDKEIVIKEFLKDRKNEMGSALFHGLIRLAYAVEEESEEELSRAMAYFDAASTEIHIKEPEKSTEDIKSSWMLLMQKRKHMQLQFTSQSTMTKVKEIMHCKELMDELTKIVTTSDCEVKILSTITQWYLMTEDFYVLHINTGFHALLTLRKYISDFDLWLKEFYLLAQVYALLEDKTARTLEYEERSWKNRMDRVTYLKDEHDIKLFYSVYSLSKDFDEVNLKKIAYLVTTR